MATYRVFMLRDDNHIFGVKLLNCQTDREAIARAPALGGDYRAVEVWDLARLVGRVEVRDSADAG